MARIKHVLQPIARAIIHPWETVNKTKKLLSKGVVKLEDAYQRIINNCTKALLVPKKMIAERRIRQTCLTDKTEGSSNLTPKETSIFGVNHNKVTDVIKNYDALIIIAYDIGESQNYIDDKRDNNITLKNILSKSLSDLDELDCNDYVQFLTVQNIFKQEEVRLRQQLKESIASLENESINYASSKSYVMSINLKNSKKNLIKNIDSLPLCKLIKTKEYFVFQKEMHILNGIKRKENM